MGIHIKLREGFRLFDHMQGAGRTSPPGEPRTGRAAGSGGHGRPVNGGRRAEPLVASVLGSRALRGSMLAALLASGVAAVPAGAAEGPQGIRPGHNITVFHDIDMVGVFGHQVGSQTQVDVFRGDHRIATARGPAVSTPDGGAVEVNHGPAGAPQPGDCWDGATPDIRPGDRIVVSNPGGQAGVDEAVVDDIAITSRTSETRDADTGGPVVVIPGQPDDPATPDVDESTPDTTEPTRQEVWVEGRAVFMNADGTPGLPIPFASLDSNGFIDLPADNQLRLAANVVEEGTGGPGTFRSRYFAPFSIERNRSGRSNASIFNALAVGEAHSAGYGHVAPLPPVSMLVDGMGEQTTAALGCEGSPKVPSSVGTTSGAVNAAAMAAAGNSDTVLTIGGWAADTVGHADVVLSNGAASVTSRARMSNGPGQVGWTAEFTKSDLASLPQGTLTAQLLADDTPAGPAKSVIYDVTAPSITVNLAEGTYTGTQSVVASAAGDSLTYQLDGAAARAVTGAIALTAGSRTLVLRATDAAGNVTTRTLPYTILAAAGQPQPTGPSPQPGTPQGGLPASGGQPASTPSGAGGGAPVAPAALIPAASVPAPSLGVAGASAARLPVATFLSGPRTIAGRAARRNGLVARFSAPRDAKRAVIRVLRRGANGRQTVLATQLATVRRGANRVVLNGPSLRRKLKAGRYVIEVRLSQAPGGKSGAATTFSIRIR
jgi:hypothetical protein